MSAVARVSLPQNRSHQPEIIWHHATAEKRYEGCQYPG